MPWASLHTRGGSVPNTISSTGSAAGDVRTATFLTIWMLDFLAGGGLAATWPAFRVTYLVAGGEGAAGEESFARISRCFADSWL